MLRTDDLHSRSLSRPLAQRPNVNSIAKKRFVIASPRRITDCITCRYLGGSRLRFLMTEFQRKPRAARFSEQFLNPLLCPVVFRLTLSSRTSPANGYRTRVLFTTQESHSSSCRRTPRFRRSFGGLWNLSMRRLYSQMPSLRMESGSNSVVKRSYPLLWTSRTKTSCVA